MKVLYICTADYKYGAAKTQIDMIETLVHDYGIVPIVLTKKHNPLNELCDERGYENYSYWYRDIMAGSAYSNWILNIAKHIVKYILYLKGMITQKGIFKCGIDFDAIDIVHSNHIRVDIGAYISRKTGLPHIWHIKELNKGHIRIVHYKRRCYKYINNNANAFIAVTNQVKQYWQKAGLDADKINVIYEGIDSNKFISKQNRNDDLLKLVCVGRIEKGKGQLQILEAIKKLPSNMRQNVRLDMYGEAYPDYLHRITEFIKDNNLEQQVKLCGYSKNIPEILSQYDVGILSSKGDAFGTVTAEYMAAGLVAVATYTELIEHGKTGFRYDFGDIDKLSETIQYIYNNRDEAEKMALKGKQEIHSHYTVDENANKVYALYKKVLDDEKKSIG